MIDQLPAAPVDEKGLLEYLQAAGFETSTERHAAVFTVDESQALHRKLKGGHTKNLFLKDKKSNYFLLTAQQDTEINLKQLHKLIGASGRLSFGKPDMLDELLGVKPGSVTAFGLINDRDEKVKFSIDQRLLEHEIINCHPLTNEATTSISKEDLLAFARATGHDPLIVDLAQEV